MTVNTTSSTVQYLGDGSTTSFTFPFPAVDPKFIFLSTQNPAGQIFPVPVTDFNVLLNPPIDPNPTAAGGTVTYPLSGPPLAAGIQLTIQRILPDIQSVSLANQSVLYPVVIEQEFDYVTMLRQASVAADDRSFRVGPTDPSPVIVPPVPQRANHSAFFDVGGNLVPGDIPSTGFISVVMAPVVGAASIPIAQQAMGIPDLIAAGLLTLYSTGDLKETLKAVADPGWIMADDGSIGNPASGATNRANVDTQPLFVLLYNNIPTLVVQNSAGTTVARGANAAADFAANRRLVLPPVMGRVLAAAGAGAGLTNRILGTSVGAETMTQTLSTLVTHTHIIANSSFTVDPGGGGGFSIASLSDIASAVTGGGAPMNNMQPTTFVNYMIKL